MKNRIHSYTIKWNTTHRIKKINCTLQMKRITHTPNQGEKLTANKNPRHAANEREGIYACAFTRKGLTPSSMLKFARFFPWSYMQMASNYVWDKIRAALCEEVSRMLGSSQTEREVSEGISPSTSLVNLRPSDRTLSLEELYEQWEEVRQGHQSTRPSPT